MTALPSGSCALVWDSETEARTKPHGRTASRSCRNPWEGNLNQSWSQEVAWSRDNPLCLLINRPWCLVSCKSDLFQIPSRGFSLLSQCLRYAFETWFGKMANAPGQPTRWAKTIESKCPRDWSISREAQDWKASALKLQSSPYLLQIQKSWAAMKTSCSQIFFFFFNSPRETSEVSGEAEHEKGWNQSWSDFIHVMEREAAACFHRELGI